MDYMIENSYKANVQFECSVAIDGWRYLVIYGRHINGFYCCIPNHKWGCEMGKSDSVMYNKEKLIECGADQSVALALAEAIKCMGSICIEGLSA